MADDELVSYWEAVDPRQPPPKPLVWADLLEAPTEEDPPPKRPRPPFCYRCGLPSRICDGSDHRAMRDVGDLRRWNDEEKILFMRKARLLTDGEKHELRHRLTWIRQAEGESNEDFFARRRALNETGKIVLGRWRIDLFKEILRGR